MSEQLIEKQDIGKVACFGKIRAKGDFVSRNLDYQVQEYLDGWLQEAFSISQEQIGSDWLKYYLTSPIWRFVISNQKINKDIIGFMMPSIDKVGRYYPLFMLEVFEDGKLCGADLHCKSFSQLEELAMSTLDGDAKSTEFFASLNQAGFPLLNEKAPVAELMHQLADSDKNISSEVTQYLWQEAGDFVSLQFKSETSSETTSIWWTEGSEGVERALLYCSDLPTANGFSAMLDGNWEHWGWQEINKKEEEEAFAAK